MSTPDEPDITGGKFQDERLRFYLRHRQQIEEWLPLGKEVRRATIEVFEGLQPELVELASSLGPDVRCEYAPGQWPEYLFSRNSWPRGPTRPLVAIALQCAKDQIDPASNSAPSVGVTVGDPTAKDLNSRLKDRVQALSGKYKKSNYWPIYRTVPASAGADWYLDIPGWRAELVQAMSEAWRDLEPQVIAALDETRATSPSAG